jgi:hypothetical protein
MFSTQKLVWRPTRKFPQRTLSLNNQNRISQLIANNQNLHNAKVVNKVMEDNLDTEATGHRDKLSPVKTTLSINRTWHPEQTTLTNTASTAKS